MIALSTGPVEVGPLLAAVGRDDHGGQALFLGTTRAEDGVTELVYEAHETLALAEMSRIADAVSARFGASVAAVHRLGSVPVGEASVAVAASAGHREEAFAACRALIDEIKASVPIWKQEVRADGATAWRDDRQAPATSTDGASQA